MLFEPLRWQELFKANQSLQFIDLLILASIIHITTSAGKPPTSERLMSYLNTFIYEHGIKEDRTLPVTSNWVLQAHIDKLRTFGFLESSDNGKMPYQLTRKGEQFIQQFGQDWRQFPVIMPVDSKNNPILEQAVYL